jgi:predicted  nucleic acid-binding Zn-ribbon protein
MSEKLSVATNTNRIERLEDDVADLREKYAGFEARVEAGFDRVSERLNDIEGSLKDVSSSVMQINEGLAEARIERAARAGRRELMMKILVPVLSAAAGAGIKILFDVLK